jgi:hypothetical protein
MHPQENAGKIGVSIFRHRNISLFVNIMIFRDWIFGHWIQASTLAVFGLSVSAGLMLGRIIGARRGILKALQALGILKPSVATNETER